MTTAYWCVLIVSLLPVVWAGFAKAGDPEFDNARPRPYLDGLGDWRQRANWAQKNAFEASPMFIGAVIIAHLVGGEQATVDMLALAFVAARILHGTFYLLNKPTLRSLTWIAGLGCVVALFLTSA
jgi:uncharacterized MAPEG superfamily protein